MSITSISSIIIIYIIITFIYFDLLSTAYLKISIND